MKYEWKPPEFGEKKENEVVAYAFAIGNLSMNPFKQKRQMEVLKYIQSMEGFCGIYPHYPHGTLCIFKTKNDAKGARNLVKAKGCPVGNNIGEIYIDKQYVPD